MRTVVVIPCYNEAERLDVAAFRKYLDWNKRIHFLFVNDGSTDDTMLLLSDLQDYDPQRVSILDLQSNSGKAEAVRRGFQEAFSSEPEFVGFWDADLATPLDAIGEFLQLLEEHQSIDAVIGARVKLLGRTIERRAIRHILGRAFAMAASLVLKLPVYDTQCGAKMFRVSPDIRECFATPFSTKWIFDVEILARLSVYSARFDNRLPLTQTVHEIPLKEWRDVAGSKLKTSDFVKAIFELMSIFRQYSKPQPLQVEETQRPASSDEGRRRRAA